jgi:hypothetical protein
MTSVNGNYKTFYEYDDNKNVVKEAIIKGTEGEIYMYTYTGANITKEKHYSFTGTYNWTGNPLPGDTEFLPEKNISKTIISETTYSYNDYGQVEKTLYTPTKNGNSKLPTKTTILLKEYLRLTAKTQFPLVMNWPIQNISYYQMTI